MNHSFVNYLRKPLALLSVGLSLFTANAAFAQTATKTAASTDDTVKLEKLVVTGSYIPMAGIATAIPVTILDAKAIENTGVASNVMEILRKAAPQFTGSGNLGATNANVSSGSTGGGSMVMFRNTQTLVLLNGRRVAYAPILSSGGYQYVDVNLFPVGAIERIEILQDGASALYGTDAISGVVNIILKSDYKGFEVSGHYGFSDNKGKWAERKFSLVGGTGTDKTGITIAAEWFMQDPMKQYERSFSSPIYGTGTFAGIVSIGSAFYALNPSLNAPPIGQHRSAAELVAAGIYIPIQSSSNLITGTGADGKYSFDLSQYPTLVIGSERKAVTLNFDHKINDAVTFFGDMLYTQTSSFSQLNAQPTSYSAAADYAYNPFNVRVTARNRFLQNPRQYYYDTNSIRGVMGMKGSVGDGMQWEMAANKNIITQQYRNEGVVDTATRGVVTADGSINYFARQQAAGAVAASGLFGTALGTATSTLTTYDVRLVGKLADIPGGELGFAVGAEYRTETLNQTSDRNSQDATFGWDSATTLDPFNSGSHVKIESSEAPWSSGKEYEGGNMGHRPPIKGGYFPVPPVDSLQDIRSAMCLALEEQGVPVEVHHHEVAAPGQCEIGTLFSSLVKRADWNQIMKYTIQNVAHSYGKTATFMPKPVVGDNGSGMHVHQSIWKAGQNLFSGNGYSGLSEFALFYIGGIIKHAKALNAITNPGTNSYKRLVPGYEAPINLAYSARNRSASIRIPFVSSPKGRRIEVRFPDPTANPYLAFAAMMMAGLDGVQNKIHPGDPIDKNLYDLPPEEAKKVPNVCSSLEMALECLDKDREFLTRGGVFSNDMLDAYIDLKMEEVTLFRMTTHPLEFQLYYSL